MVRIYKSGDEIYDLARKKRGRVRYQRDDINQHNYYFINYCGGDFSTYVSVNQIMDYDDYFKYSVYNAKGEQLIFSKGEEIYDIEARKKGTICYLRDDEEEKKSRSTNNKHYFYSIKYQDGTIGTYVNAIYIINYTRYLAILSDVCN